MIFAEQQIAKERVKREDYLSPVDIMWPKQWYLVSLCLSHEHSLTDYLLVVILKDTL